MRPARLSRSTSLRREAISNSLELERGQRRPDRRLVGGGALAQLVEPELDGAQRIAIAPLADLEVIDDVAERQLERGMGRLALGGGLCRLFGKLGQLAAKHVDAAQDLPDRVACALLVAVEPVENGAHRLIGIAGHRPRAGHEAADRSLLLALGQGVELVGETLQAVLHFGPPHFGPPHFGPPGPVGPTARPASGRRGIAHAAPCHGRLRGMVLV